jgi:hypothetical protein
MREAVMNEDTLNTIESWAVRTASFADAAADAPEQDVRLALLTEIKEKAIGIHDPIATQEAGR